jgi:hypothetical protein
MARHSENSATPRTSAAPKSRPGRKKIVKSGSPNFIGRFEFLDALARLFPKLLLSLRDEVYLPHKNQWRSRKSDEMDAPFSEVGEGPHVDALRLWGQKHGFADWLYDAAVHTLKNWAMGDMTDVTTSSGTWVYLPREFVLRPFLPQGAYWMPRMPRGWTRKEFKSKIIADLDKYLDSLQAECGASADSQIRLHAEWTALRFTGLTTLKIMTWTILNRARRHDNAETTINKAVSRFRKSFDIPNFHRTAKP